MATTLLHLRSTTPGAVPTAEQLSVGELAVNLADKKWFTKKADGTIVCLNQLTVLDGGEILGLTGWNVTTAAYSQNFSVGAQDATALGMFFRTDGLKMYVVGANADAVNEYNLGAAWNVATAVYVQNFSVAAQETSPTAVFFKPDGLKFYVAGTTGDDVNEYVLSTAWDISTATYSQNFSVFAQERNPNALFFSADGLKMYVAGSGSSAVNGYQLNAAWDISTANYAQNFDLSAREPVPTGIFFKPDGRKLYVLGNLSDNVDEYDLSVAWDITTASYLRGFSVGNQDGFPNDIFFSPDGLKMYMVGILNSAVYEYTLQPT